MSSAGPTPMWAGASAITLQLPVVRASTKSAGGSNVYKTSTDVDPLDITPAVPEAITSIL